MENSKSQSDNAQADKSKSKTGVIPKEEIKGSGFAGLVVYPYHSHCGLSQ